MKRLICALMLMIGFSLPTVAMAKGIPLFFNTGDEAFEIKGAEPIDAPYKLGYICQRFGLFGADIWTWDCKMMAVDKSHKVAAELPAEMQAKYASKYSEGDRDRDFWEHYGILITLAVVAAYAGFQILRK